MAESNGDVCRQNDFADGIIVECGDDMIAARLLGADAVVESQWGVQCYFWCV